MYDSTAIYIQMYTHVHVHKGMFCQSLLLVVVHVLFLILVICLSHLQQM
jgi:hypothetical protein